MTHKRAQEIGRALLAAGCGWREGMRASCYADWGRVTRVFDHDDGTQTVYASFDHESASGDLRDYDPAAWPDVRDAATRGVLLEIVRERWGDDLLYIKIQDDSEYLDQREWCLILRDGKCKQYGASEEEVLLAALQFAPEVNR